MISLTVYIRDNFAYRKSNIVLVYSSNEQIYPLQTRISEFKDCSVRDDICSRIRYSLDCCKLEHAFLGKCICRIRNTLLFRSFSISFTSTKNDILRMKSRQKIICWVRDIKSLRTWEARVCSTHLWSAFLWLPSWQSSCCWYYSGINHNDIFSLT
jgi:hypothetical protein